MAFDWSDTVSATRWTATRSSDAEVGSSALLDQLGFSGPLKKRKPRTLGLTLPSLRTAQKDLMSQNRIVNLGY